LSEMSVNVASHGEPALFEGVVVDAKTRNHVRLASADLFLVRYIGNFEALSQKINVF